MADQERPRYVTKGVRNRVDNILQHLIWKEFITPAKLKGSEFLEIRLLKCPYSKMQMVNVVDTLGKNIDKSACYNVHHQCDEELIVLYDKEKDSEFMMLRSESEYAIALDKKRSGIR